MWYNIYIYNSTCRTIAAANTKRGLRHRQLRFSIGYYSTEERRAHSHIEGEIDLIPNKSSEGRNDEQTSQWIYAVLLNNWNSL